MQDYYKDKVLNTIKGNLNPIKDLYSGITTNQSSESTKSHFETLPELIKPENKTELVESTEEEVTKVVENDETLPVLLEPEKKEDVVEQTEEELTEVDENQDESN